MTDAAPKRIWAWYLHNKMRNDAMEGGWTASPDKREHAYILVTPEALASSPEVAALIREAEARGMERAQSLARRLANDSEREAERKDTTAQQRIGLNLVRDTAATLESAFRAEAAAIRREATK